MLNSFSFIFAIVALPVAAGADLGLLQMNDATRRETLERMRASGSVDQLVADYAEMFTRLDSQLSATPEESRERNLLEQAFDYVTGQRYGAYSRLFWHTDLEAAKAVAQREGKPILSLRLLGKLTEERSCANSRFFRAVLYPNAQVADMLRRDFVLHWSSERPVPQVTIDFGDGRKLETTLTGNSAHYVLDKIGRPVDVLPGLYDAHRFLSVLERARSVALHLGNADEIRRRAMLAEFHAQEAERLRGELVSLVGVARVGDAERIAGDARSSAAAAGLRALSKIAVERPILRGLSPQFAAELASAEGDTLWDEVGARLPVALDSTAERIIQRTSPALADSQFLKTLAADSARNELLFHRIVHEWFAGGASDWSFIELNDRVYAELFRTPSADPWLGLRSAYDALSKGF